MRLTLRTLLAYMDDILEPADHEDLGRKIEASDFATELIHRSRDVVRRLRLSAPAVDAGEDSEDVLGGPNVSDANAVAEYLDNTLPPDDVADFERMCLEPGNEADMHLAEVASCHHVLTMVLGEPADINQNLKQRFYRMPEQVASGELKAQKLRIESAHVEHHAPPATAPIAPAPVAAPTPAPVAQAAPAPVVAAESDTELPDYLRAAADSRKRTKRIVMAVAAVAFVGFVAWFVSPGEPEIPAEIADADTEAFMGDLDIEIQSDVPGDASVAAESSAGGEAPAWDAASSSDSEAPAFVPESPADTATAELAEDPVIEAVELPGIDIDAEETPEPVEEEISEIADAESEITEPTEDAEPVESAESTDELASVSGQPVGPEAEPSLPATEEPVDAVAEEPETPVIETPVASTIPVIETPEPPVEPEPQGPIQLGNYIGNKDILLRYAPNRQQWIRLAPRSAIFSDETLLCLPKFRTHAVLGDLNVYLTGGTRLELPLPADRISSDDSEIELAVNYGRLLINAGLKGKSLSLSFGDEVRSFQMDGSASLAVEVKRVFVPGDDFSSESPVEATWYLTSGSVSWPNAAGSEETIEGPAMWKTAEGVDDLPENVFELPEWIDGEPLTDSEIRARNTFSEELVSGQPVSLRLLELNDVEALGRRKEVRTLAAEASVYVGIFEPSVNALNDSEQSRTWGLHIDTLRQAMARSPEKAELVREAFVKMRGKTAAADLVEMLQGYSLEEIGETREERQSGVLAKLVEWLEHDSLDYRVLAIHNLNEITGTSYLGGYLPAGTSQRRQIAVKKIWKRLESGDLAPAE